MSSMKSSLSFFDNVNLNFDKAAQFTKHPERLLDQINACNSIYHFQFPIQTDAGYEVTPRSQWEISADGTVQRYLGPFAVPSKLVVALRSYSDARLRYFRKLRALRRLEAEKSARDARIESEVARDAALLPATALWSSSAKP